MTTTPARPDHLTAMHAQLTAAGYTTRPAKLALMTEALGRKVLTSKGLTTAEVNQIVRLVAERETAYT